MLLYCKINEYGNNMEYAIYTDELNNILSQLENNQQLLTNLKQNKIDPKSIAF